MTPPKRPAHAGLERHNQRLAKAREALRRAEDHERRASSAVEVARDHVREAHDVGADPSKATSALHHAKTNSEQAVLAREGVEQRVKRAAAEREGFLEEHGEALLAELGHDCEKVAEDIRTAAEALIAADRRWRELSMTVSRYLSGARLVPHENSPSEHGLESVVRALRRALQHGIRDPSPHWHRRDAARVEHENVARLRREREAA